MNEPDAVRTVLRALNKIAWVAVAACVVLLALYGIASYQDRKTSADAARKACRTSKLDRIDNAASWTAHREYIESVVLAASVKEDVKRAARRANRVHRRTARRLTARARVDCAREHPPASILP